MNRPQTGIATDGAHSSKNGSTRYRAVDIATGKQLFIKHIGRQTVNIGEFLGLVEAVKYIITTGFLPQVVYSDSTTAIAWFKEKNTASAKKNKDMTRAEIFLKAFDARINEIKVLHWNNTAWGEIPADFGEK